MSARPLVAAEEPERGGDGRRRRWSESPIPRVATRRVRTVGAAGTPCAGYDWVRTSFGDTFAEFSGTQGYVSLGVIVDYDCTHVGDVDIWVQDLTLSSGTDPTPTAAQTIAGPEVPGTKNFSSVAGSGTVTGIRIEWDVAGALTTCCITTINEE